MKKIVALLAVASGICSAVLNAQPAMFGNATPVFQPGFTGNDYARDVKQISNGEYVVAGSWQATAALGGLNGYLNYYNNVGGVQRSVTFVSAGGDDVWGADALLTSPTTADIYVTGFFTGTMNVTLTIGAFSTPLGTFNAPSGIGGDVTYFIAKFNQAGGLQWLYTAGNVINAREEGHDITVEQVGGTRLIYTTGMIRGQSAFNGFGPSIGLVSTGTGDDAFVASYTDNGATATVNWVNLISGTTLTGNDIGKALDADAMGNVFVTGGYRGGAANFSSTPPAVGISTTVSYGNDDAFVVRYSAAGAAVVAMGYGGSAAGPAAASPVEQGRGIVVNAANNLVYVSGFYIGYTAPNTGSFGPAAFSGGYEGFLVGMQAADLVAGFYRTVRTTQDDFCYKMDIDPTNDGTTLVPGSFGGVSGFVFDETNTVVYTQPGCVAGGDGFVLRCNTGAVAPVMGVVCGTGADIVTAVDVVPNFSYICGHTASATLAFESSLTTITNAGAPNWDAFSARCLHFSLLRLSNLSAVESPEAQLYPNPTNQQFTLQLEVVSDDAPAQLFLFDVTGRTVLQQQLTQAQTSISIDGLLAGAYFWRVVQNESVSGEGKLVITD